MRTSLLSSTSWRARDRGAARAPSTALRAVPLPRYRGAGKVSARAPSTTRLALRALAGGPPPPLCGGGKMRHIFNSRLALPLRILALSSSQSGTVCIHSIAGGFMTNGQSTANRI